VGNYANTLQFLSGGALSTAILTAALIGARVLPVTTLASFMGGDLVPPEIKIGTGIALTLLLFPLVASEPPPREVMVYLALLAKEVAMGVVLAFVAGLVFETMRLAGTLIDTAGGANMATAMVPEIQEQATLFANLKFQMSVVLFFAVGGHRLFFTSLFQSFEAVPLMRFPELSRGFAPLIELVVRMAADILITGFMLAAPVMAAIFITDAALGLLNRVAPTIQVYFLALPLKMMLAIAVVLLSLTLMVGEMKKHMGRMLGRLDEVIDLMR
jgi:flagellar biosynthetic protein FliR